jgi:hypothetical protein
MRHFKKSIGPTVVIFTFLAFVLTGCGGGGGGGTTSTGGGTTEASLTAANAPQAGGAAMQSANLVGGATALGELRPLGISSDISSKTHSKPPLPSILDRLIPIAKSRMHGSALRLEGSFPPTTENCTGGGTVTVSGTWTGPDNPTDPSQIVNFAGNITFNSCKEATGIMNGSISMRIEGPLDDFTKFTVSVSSFAYANTETNDNIAMTNLTMVITGLSLNGSELAGGTITIAGAVSGTVGGDPINVEYDGYQIVFDSDAGGETVSVSGRIRASCLGGWVTIATNIPLFTRAGAACPTTGEVVITSGGNHAKIVVASDSRITIYYNNTLVQTYSNCENVDGLCAG